ncbi:MAG: aldo/keto reductase [Rhodoluna sp.]|nr:aldo/keto reductase [Rhodoluna sp.]
MTLHTLAKTDLQISNLCLGGNVFGWSADERQSHDVLNLYSELGGNFIDTADVYSEWGEGHVGGESESVIGSWLKSRASTDDVVIATKVSKLSTRPGLGRANILAACDDSLRRLGRDHIDLYYSHDDDKDTPLEETLAAFTELQRAGKIRFAAASNYTGARLLEAAQISKEQGLIEYSALQNHYNLIEREEYERDSVPALAELGIEGVPFFGLARGFLSGKYREGVEVESVRATGVTKYTNEHGWAVLAKLDRLANHHSVSLSATALAWLRQQPSVAAPIASARTTEQLREIMTHVNLTTEELQFLTD